MYTYHQSTAPDPMREVQDAEIEARVAEYQGEGRTPDYVYRREDSEVLPKLTEAELRELLGLPNNNVNMFEVNMTKEQAKRILKTNNDHNRPISNRYVNTLRKDMDNGKWERGNDNLAFSPDGTLTNGQHRLTAFATSTMPSMQVGITFKVPHFMGMDTNKRRSFSDNVVLFNDASPCFKKRNFSQISEVVTAYTKICTGHYCNLHLSQNELMDVANALAGKISVCETMGLLARASYTGIAPIRASYIVALQAGVSPDLLRAVKIALDTGVLSDPDVAQFISPEFSTLIIRTRDRLMQMGRTSALETAKKVYLVQSLIDKVNKGIPVSYLKSTKNTVDEIEFSYYAGNMPHIEYKPRNTKKKQKAVETEEE